MARRFDEEGGFTLADFVDRLRADLRSATKETQAATTDEQGPIIRLMSIHQAKGLEFPIVVVPDLDRKRPGELRRVAFDPVLGPLVNPTAEPEGDDAAETGGSLGWTVYRHREKAADDAEALRLFYVATTRARDFLILSSATDPSRPPTSPALALLDRRFDRSTGLLREPPPLGRAAARVEVIEASEPPGQIRTGLGRARPDLPAVAEAIREGGMVAGPDPTPEPTRPRLVELDPASGLSTTSARLDRLVRSILADPRALEPKGLDRAVELAARRQDPVATPALIDRAVALVSGWARGPIAREIARASEVRRDFAWSVEWPAGRDRLVFQGRGDFLGRTPAGAVHLDLLGDPRTPEPIVLLRVLLSARAAELQGFGAVARATWSAWEPGQDPRTFERIDGPAIDRAVEAYLSFVQ